MPTETNITPGTELVLTSGQTVTVASKQDQHFALPGDLAVIFGPSVFGPPRYVGLDQIAGVKADTVSVPLDQVALDADVDTEWNYDLIELAIDHKRMVSFDYRKADGSTVTRTITPEEVVVSNANKTLIVGFDEDRDDTRSYRLDRIVGAVSA